MNTLRAVLLAITLQGCLGDVASITNTPSATTATTLTTTGVFDNGEPTTLLPLGYSYAFQIPTLVTTPMNNLLAIAQGYVRQDDAVIGRRLDGNDGWIDLVSKRSEDGGKTWGPLALVLRNSTAGGETHACQNPAPVVDMITKTVLLMSSLDNWHVLLQTSNDDGRTFGPPRNLDESLRLPGWGLVYTGLPQGIQLVSPSPKPGRLVLCSSAYWSGGLMVNGKIVQSGDVGSRYSYAITSDDHGLTWKLGSKIEPRHTTECAVAQRFDGDGSVWIYSRIWDKNCAGCEGYGRGIAESKDGGDTWSKAMLRGLTDTTPDVEGSFTSAKVGDTTCFFVSAPHSSSRHNLAVQSSCGITAPNGGWSVPVVVDPGPSSYSAIAVSSGKLFDLWAYSYEKSPNDCLGFFNNEPGCAGGIRVKELKISTSPAPTPAPPTPAPANTGGDGNSIPFVPIAIGAAVVVVVGIGAALFVQRNAARRREAALLETVA